MGTIQLIAGSTIDAGLKGLAIDERTANWIKGTISDAAVCGDEWDVRERLPKLLKQVDMWLPRMVGDRDGLHILNPNVMQIVDPLFVQVRDRLRGEDDGSYDRWHVTSGTIGSARDLFMDALETQMANGAGPIFSAIRLSQTLYCDLSNPKNMSCSSTKPVMSSFIFQEAAAGIVKQYVQTMRAIPEPQVATIGDPEVEAAENAYQNASRQLTALTGFATAIGDGYGLLAIQRAQDVLSHRRQQYEDYKPSWISEARITACIALTLCWGGGREERTLARQALRSVTANMLSPELAQLAE